MSTIDKELRFLAKWAQEESAVECWHLPAHQHQIHNRWPSIAIVKRIRARLDAANMRDGELASIYDGQPLDWPWIGMTGMTDTQPRALPSQGHS